MRTAAARKIGSELTDRQEGFVENLFNPKIQTKKMAAVLAGCSPRSAGTQASLMLRLPHVQRAIHARERETGDITRKILEKAAKKVAENLERDGDNPSIALGTWKVAADIVEKVGTPVQSELTSKLKAAKAGRTVMQAALTGYRLAINGVSPDRMIAYLERVTAYINPEMASGRLLGTGSPPLPDPIVDRSPVRPKPRRGRPPKVRQDVVVDAEVVAP